MTDAIPSVTVKNGLGNKEEKFKKTAHCALAGWQDLARSPGGPRTTWILLADVF